MTKKQRNEAYRFAYEEISESDDRLICVRLLYHNPELGAGLIPEMIKEHYPELWLFRPEGYRSNWFTIDPKGQRERLTCLAFCIAMTDTKNYQWRVDLRP